MYMTDEKPTDPTSREPSWAGLLFGEDPWPMLVVMLACGLLIYILARDALPAVLIVVLIGLAANIWLTRRAEEAAEEEDRS